MPVPVHATCNMEYNIGLVGEMLAGCSTMQYIIIQIKYNCVAKYLLFAYIRRVWGGVANGRERER